MVGVVRDASTNQIIGGATVQIFKDGIIVAETTTDFITGAYVLTGLSSGSYTVTVNSSNYIGVTLGASVTAGISLTLNFSLPVNPGNITGTVRSLNSLTPVAGATVRLEKNGILVGSAITNASGVYTINGVAPGSYSLQVLADTFITSSQGVIVLAGLTVTANFSLPSSLGSITGLITNINSGLPIASATVKVSQNGTIVGTALTDALGIYTISGLAAGSYSVQAQAANFQSAIKGGLVNASLTTTVNIGLTPNSGRIFGTVIDSLTRDPVKGASINLLLKGISVAQVVSNDLGQYTIPNVAEGTYVLLIQASLYQSANQGAIVVSSVDTKADVLLSPTQGRIAGTVRKGNDPIVGATIQVQQLGNIVATVLTDDSGNYSINGLAPGAYTIQAMAQNFQTVIIGAIVLANFTTSENFSLIENPGTLFGAITNALTGQPIIGATIKVELNDVVIVSGLSDNSGNYKLSSLPIGPYTIKIEAQDFQTKVQGIQINDLANLLNVALNPSPGVVAGVVKDQVSGAVIPKALVQVEINGVVSASAVTDENGNYKISGLSPGAYNLHITASQYQTALIGVIIIPNISVPVDIFLLPSPGSISGVITEIDGSTPLPGTVFALDTNGAIIRVAKTDSAGNYLLIGMAPGNYVIQARATDHQLYIKGVTVVTDVNATVNFALTLDPGKITGVVYDPSTNQPIKGAAIEVQSLSLSSLDEFSATGTASYKTLTDENGQYMVEGLPPGSYSVQANATNYQHDVKGVIVLPNLTSSADFLLLPSPGSILGSIIDEVTLLPIPSAVVALDNNGIVLASTLTDPSGNYLIPGLAPGSYQIQARALNYQTKILGVIVSANQTTELNITLLPSPGVISGVITNNNGDPIVAALVNLKLAGSTIATVVTDDFGKYTFMSVAPGVYTIQAQAKNFQFAVVGAIVLAEQTIEINIKLLDSPGNILGTVVNENADPIISAVVELDANGTFVAQVITDASGNFAINGVAPGVYNLNVKAKNYQHASQGVIILPSTSSLANFILSSEPGSLSGRVIDDISKSPISGVLIKLQETNNKSLLGITAVGNVVFTTFTDTNGYYLFEGISRGSYAVSVSAKDYQGKTQGAIINPSEETILDFSLLRSPGSISGRVLNDSDQPLLATVAVLDSSGNIIALAFTDPDGKFSLLDLAPQAVTLRVVAADFETQVQGVLILPNLNTPIDFKLSASPGVIFGQVKDDLGATISGASIVIEKNNVIIASTLSDSSGNYRLVSLAPGIYNISVKASGFQTVLLGAQVLPNIEVETNFFLLKSPGGAFGSITDAFGEPVIGALITIDNGGLVASVISDQYGQYQISGLAPGAYNIEVRAQNYQRMVKGLNIAPTVNSQVDFELVLSPAMVGGVVTNEQTGEPIAQAFIEVTDASLLGSPSIMGLTAITDNLGHYEIDGIPPGSYVITARAENYQTQTLGFFVEAEGSAVVDFSLKPNPGAVSGVITSENQAVSGALIEIKQNNLLVFSTFSDQVGNYRIDGIAPGSYTIQVSAQNHQTVVHGLSIVANQEISLDFSLALDPGDLAGIIKSGDKIITGALIEIEKEGVIIRTAISDDSGYFKVSGLAPGSYSVQVQAQNYERAIIGAVIVANQTATLEFNLGENPGSVLGQVKNESGEPVIGAIITLIQNDKVLMTAISDASGNFNIIGIASGSYILQAQAPNYVKTSQALLIEPSQTETIDLSLKSSPGNIAGTVRDATNAILGALIEVFQNGSLVASVLSDQVGQYSLANLAQGSYTISASAKGYQHLILGVTVLANQTTSLDFTLASNPGSVSGVVRDSKTLAPISGTIVALDINGVKTFTSFSDSQGNYLISGITPGSYIIQAQAEGFETKPLGVIIVADQTIEADILLDKSPGKVLGLITDEHGDPIANAFIEVKSNGLSVGSTHSDSLGNYSIQGLSEGSYTIQVQAQNYGTVVGGLLITALQTSVKNFILIENPGSVAGTILDGQNHPILGSVTLLDTSGSVISSVFADQNGQFILSGIASDTYVIKVSADGFETNVQSIRVFAGQTTTLEILLNNSFGTITGQVVDEQNIPIFGALIKVESNGVVIAQTLSDATGNYNLLGVSLGFYQIHAQADGFQALVQGVQVTNQTSEVNFKLVKNPGSIRGQVLDQNNPVSGAVVDLLLNDSIIESKVADGSGQFLFSNVAQGAYTIRAKANGYITKTQGVIVSANSESLVSINLDESPGSISGTVIDENQQPIKDALIEVKLNDIPVASAFTDINGFYRIDGLAAGFHSIKASASGFEVQNKSVLVVANTETSLDFVLGSSPGSVYGKVTNQIGQPIAGAFISVEHNGEPVANGFTDTFGNYSITGLAAGFYSIKASATDYQVDIFGLKINPSEAVLVNFELSNEAGRITGVVVEEGTNKPIVGAIVEILFTNISRTMVGEAAPNALLYTQTDSQGHYILVGVPRYKPRRLLSAS